MTDLFKVDRRTVLRTIGSTLLPVKIPYTNLVGKTTSTFQKALALMEDLKKDRRLLQEYGRAVVATSTLKLLNRLDPRSFPTTDYEVARFNPERPACWRRPTVHTGYYYHQLPFIQAKEEHLKLVRNLSLEELESLIERDLSWSYFHMCGAFEYGRTRLPYFENLIRNSNTHFFLYDHYYEHIVYPEIGWAKQRQKEQDEFEQANHLKEQLNTIQDERPQYNQVHGPFEWIQNYESLWS
jgi:hypothetical protein